MKKFLFLGYLILGHQDIPCLLEASDLLDRTNILITQTPSKKTKNSGKPTPKSPSKMKKTTKNKKKSKKPDISSMGSKPIKAKPAQEAPSKPLIPRFYLDVQGLWQNHSGLGIHFLKDTYVSFYLMGAKGSTQIFPFNPEYLSNHLGLKANAHYVIAVPPVKTSKNEEMEVESFGYSLTPSLKFQWKELTVFLEPLTWLVHSFTVTMISKGFAPCRSFWFQGLSAGLPITWTKGPLIVKLDNQYYYNMTSEGDITYNDKGERTSGPWMNASGYHIGASATFVTPFYWGIGVSGGIQNFMSTLSYDLVLHQKLSQKEEVNFNVNILYASLYISGQL